MTASTDDFFRSRLDYMIDLRHPLAVLASRMPWQEIEASLAHRFARQVRTGKQIEDSGLFGPTVITAGAGWCLSLLRDPVRSGLRVAWQHKSPPNPDLEIF